MQKHDVGFVGLGAMGQLVARRFLGAGLTVCGFDLSTEALGAFEADGGIVANDAAATSEATPMTVLFVVNAQQAESVLFDEGGIADRAADGHIIISCVTMSASDARAIAKCCTERGLIFLDAPVSGGTVGAEAGTLSIMASGPADAYTTCMPIFSAMGKHILHVGLDAGQGSSFKTINQMLCGVHLAIAGEALALAEKAGLDPRQVFELVSQSAASSWMLNDRGPAMLERHYQPVNSAVDIFVKDLGVVQDLARELKFPATVSSAALQSFLGASGAGMGQMDDSAVTEFYRLISDHESTDAT